MAKTVIWKKGVSTAKHEAKSAFLQKGKRGGENETGCENLWSRKFNRAKESDEKGRERRKQEVHYCSWLFFLPFKLLFRIEVAAKVAVFQIRKLVRGATGGGISDGPISPTFYSFREKICHSRLVFRLFEKKFKSVSQFVGNSTGEKEECWENFVLRDGGRCDVQPTDENESNKNW